MLIDEPERAGHHVNLVQRLSRRCDTRWFEQIVRVDEHNLVVLPDERGERPLSKVRGRIALTSDDPAGLQRSVDCGQHLRRHHGIQPNPEVSVAIRLPAQ